MALRKRGKKYHADFVVDGQRYRQALNTTDRNKALAAMRNLIGEAKDGKLSAKKTEIAKLDFRAGAARFLEDRVAYLAERSVQTEKERAKAVCKQLGEMAVSRISVADVQAYIRERKKAGIANATINRELDVIRGVLKKAKRWHHFADDVRPLPVRQTVGRALSYEEKLHLLRVAAARPEWQNAALATTLALNTTARGSEIKGLRWRDIDMVNRTLTIRKSKTDAGERHLPLNADAWNVIVALYRRAHLFSGLKAHHYLFPACETAHIDPEHPQKTWRTSWRSLTRVVACPSCKHLQRPTDICSVVDCRTPMKGLTSPLAGLRFHDLRHHAITELAEGQTSDATIKSIAGHVSQKMLDHYSHVRIQAKRNALDALSMKRPVQASLEVPEGCDVTNGVTKNSPTACPMPYVIDSLVELSGIEPLTSSLRNRYFTYFQ